MIRFSRSGDMPKIKQTKCVFPFLFILFMMTISTLWAKEYREDKILSHNIEIELYLNEHKLMAVDHMRVQARNEERFSCLINGAFQVLSVGSSNKKLAFKTIRKGDGYFLEITIPSDLRQADSVVLDIAYEGHLFEKPASLELEDVGGVTGIIDEAGVYLSPACLWYPDTPGSLAAFTVTVTTPEGYEAVTLGALISRRSVDGKTYTTWEEKNVSEGCDLVAGRYTVTSVNHNGIDIYAYFFPEEQGLVETYVNATKRYLDMYQKLLGDYPYKKFAIVENFFQTGYGMPSFTLLGNSVVKMPFIVDTSLGHEILHNWWGNSVFVDESQGNWCEGLTTYMADYYYKELKDNASAEEYRNDICRKYTNYVTGKNDFPLKNFIGRRDQATRAIGYGKTAMVFHMLRRMVGDEVFYQSLRSLYRGHIWKKAGWKDIRRVFEDAGKRDLSWFFEQWINQAGAPFLTLGKTEVEKVKDGWVTRMEVIQKDHTYQISLPVHLELAEGNYHTIVEVKGQSEIISIQTQSEPQSLAIDPHYEVFRRLHIEEIPTTIDFVLGDNETVVVYPTSGERSLQEAYKNLAESFVTKKSLVKPDTGITEAEITQKSLFILGGPTENKHTKRLMKNLPEDFSFGEGTFVVNKVRYQEKGNAVLVSSRNARNKTKGVIFFAGLSADAIAKTGFKIPHYGKYSYLAFTDGKNIDKGVFAVTDSPLRRSFRK